MKSFASPNPNRRAFLRFLAGSPYVAALGGIRAFAQRAPGIAEVIANSERGFQHHGR
jgi:hypothetical protein